jgi:hypothetical protein
MSIEPRGVPKNTMKLYVIVYQPSETATGNEKASGYNT